MGLGESHFPPAQTWKRRRIEKPDSTFDRAAHADHEVTRHQAEVKRWFPRCGLTNLAKRSFPTGVTPNSQ